MMINSYSCMIHQLKITCLPLYIFLLLCTSSEQVCHVHQPGFWPLASRPSVQHKQYTVRTHISLSAFENQTWVRFVNSVHILYNRPDDSLQQGQQKQRHLVLGLWYNKLGLCNTWSLLFSMHISRFSVHIVNRLHRLMTSHKLSILWVSKTVGECNDCYLSSLTHTNTHTHISTLEEFL